MHAYKFGTFFITLYWSKFLILFFPISSTHSSNGIKGDDPITFWISTVIKAKIFICWRDVNCIGRHSLSGAKKNSSLMLLHLVHISGDDNIFYFFVRSQPQCLLNGTDFNFVINIAVILKRAAKPSWELRLG